MDIFDSSLIAQILQSVGSFVIPFAIVFSVAEYSLLWYIRLAFGREMYFIIVIMIYILKIFVLVILILFLMKMKGILLLGIIFIMIYLEKLKFIIKKI